jgi:integrase
MPSNAALRRAAGPVPAVGRCSSPASGPLLVTASGARLDQPALFRLVRRLARAAQLPACRQLAPHSLRHSFATIYLDHGGNLRDLQDAPGHASPTTTRRCDRDRHNLNRDATFTVGAALALPGTAVDGEPGSGPDSLVLD